MNYSTVTALVLLSMCLILWFVLIPNMIKLDEDAVFPRLVVFVLAFLSILLLAQAARSSATVEGGLDFPTGEALWLVLAVTVLFTVNVLIMRLLGFYLTSLIFLPICMFVVGVRNWRVLILVPAILISSIYGLMELVLYSPLPRLRLF
ncbi:MAG: tripartite tricarboxylate transporter TctB family protein [Alphaproteobacteria bacterium]|nr:tripartite tricarboxylate transporter TctB family protein [Alphaproteobacteria bacterium]